jgi:hypothetical protein
MEWCLVKHRDFTFTFMDFQEIECDVEWMHLARNSDQWRGFVETVMNVRVQ